MPIALENTKTVPCLAFIAYKVLVVDDDCDDSSLIAETIDDLAPTYQVTCISKPSAALDYLHSLSLKELPNLIILDYQMPLFNGAQMLQKLKADSRYTLIPVTVYSHSSFPRHREECLEAGASLYLIKTNSIKALREDVQKMLAYCS